MRKKISIYTIANKVGVSTATISKVINNKGYVSEATSKRVLATMQEYNYMPIQRKHTNNIIGVVCFHNDRLLASPFTNKLMTGILQQTFEVGSELLIIDGNDLLKMNSEELYRYRFLHSIRGFLLINADVESPLMDAMTTSEIPFINVANTCTNFSFNYISSYNYESTMEIIEYIIRMGHHRIAFVGTLIQKMNCHNERYRGYLAAMERHHLSVDLDFVIDIPDLKLETWSNAVKYLMGRSEAPTAIFFVNTECGNILHSVLTTLNYKIPADVSLAGCYEMEGLFFPKNNFTSFAQPAEEIGSLAIKKLKELSINPEKPIHLYVKNTISYGDTVKKLN